MGSNPIISTRNPTRVPRDPHRIPLEKEGIRIEAAQRKHPVDVFDRRRPRRAVRAATESQRWSEPCGERTTTWAYSSAG